MFKSGIIDVEFKGDHVNVEFLLSSTGICNVYPLLAIHISNGAIPIVSLKQTLDQASIVRVTLFNDYIDRDILESLVIT